MSQTLCAMGFARVFVFVFVFAAMAIAAPAGSASKSDGGVAAPAAGSAQSRTRMPTPFPIPGPAAADSEAPPPDEYQLQRASDGSNELVYEAPGFTARVARDGSVSFGNRHISKQTFIPFLPGPPPTGVPTLEGTLRGLGKKKRQRAEPPRDPIADETRNPSTTVSRYRPDPREICQYPRPCFFEAPVIQVGTQARLDLTDELMRFEGQDPYRVSKARFLAATHELRVRMAARAHAQDLAQSRAELPARLRMIACDARLLPRERRAIMDALRAEQDLATPEGRQSAEQIRRFLDQLDRGDGGARCQP
jgi:hypothetical protein